VIRGEQSAERALAAYHRFSARHRPAFTAAFALQHAIPRLPPKTLTRLLQLTGRRRPCHALFSWYLTIADPAFAHA